MKYTNNIIFCTIALSIITSQKKNPEVIWERFLNIDESIYTKTLFGGNMSFETFCIQLWIVFSDFNPELMHIFKQYISNSLCEFIEKF